MEPLPADDSERTLSPRDSTGAYFNTPMQHTPGQRVHTVEGPGRLSGSNRCIGSASERMVNTGDPAAGFKRRSGGSTSMPVAQAGPTTFAPLAEGPSPPKAADSEPPLTSEPQAAVSAESSIDADTPAGPSAAAMAAFGGKPLPFLGQDPARPGKTSSWVKAKVGLDLTNAVENVAAQRANDGLLKRASFTSVVESAKNLAEERRQSKIEKQKRSQYFNPSVVGSVNRHRRIQSSRRTRMIVILDEPRSSRLALTVFVTMLGFIFVSVCLVVVDSMGPPDDIKDSLWWIEVGCSVVFCVEFAVRLLGVNSFWSLFSDAYMWIDFLSIVPFIVDISYELSSEGEKDEASPLLDALRLARLLRLLKLARHNPTLTLTQP